MKKLDDHNLGDRGLYETQNLPLLGNHLDRKLAINVEGGGRVNLNVLAPGARAGNHYHQKVIELFINPGPGTLLLHLRAAHAEAITVVEMLPASMQQIRAYRPKLGVTHMVENASPHTMTLIIVVDQNDPSDVFPLEVYPSLRQGN